MPARVLDGIKRDLQHDLGPNHAGVAEVADRHLEEPFGVLGDLGVGQPGVRLADVDQLAGSCVFDRKRVVGQHAPSLAVPPFDRRHHHIQRRERPLQLQPCKAAATGGTTDATAAPPK